MGSMNLLPIFLYYRKFNHKKIVMKRAGLFLILFVMSIVAKAQNTEAEVGEVLRIGESKNYGYTYVKLPKSNFIIKKGSVLNFDNLNGTLVVISEITSGKNDEKVVVLKRKDGRKFFGSFPSIKARYNLAISSGELSRT